MNKDFFNKLFVHPQYCIYMYIDVASNKQWHNCLRTHKKIPPNFKKQSLWDIYFLHYKTIHQTSFFLIWWIYAICYLIKKPMNCGIPTNSSALRLSVWLPNNCYTKIFHFNQSFLLAFRTVEWKAE